MTQDAALYNARIITLYLKLVRERYPHVSITEILNHSGLEPYEIADEGHWLTQDQIDRFYEKIVQLTGNEQIAREAGRMAASPGAIGIMRQYTLGLLSPFQAFSVLNKATKNITRSSEYISNPIAKNKVEITVRPHPGVQEQPFQCENRMGFFEAIVSVFNIGMPKIEHPECLFRGGRVCRYTVTWKRTFTHLAGRFRNMVTAFSGVTVAGGLALAPEPTLHYVLPTALIACMAASLITEISRRRELETGMSRHWDTAERLTEQIDINYRNVQLTQEIGQALANKKSVDDVLRSVVQVMENRLDFNRGAILLSDPEKIRLEIRGTYGYTANHLGSLARKAFNLNKPNSQSPFVISFRDQKPFMVDNIKKVEDRLTPKSRDFIQELGVKSFLCCPIVVEGESLGIIAVDNLASRRPLNRSDVSLLQGISTVIGVALQNAALVEAQQSAFEKTLKILADSIDARDFLTAGHSEVVMEYAAGIAEELGLDEEYIQMIRIAALLHDYGKIGVPDSILKKDGRLTEEERAIINTHPAKTREILSQVPFQGIQTQIPKITGAHHERWDGNGYPEGLAGEEIPRGARILAVADFFEAITSKRHYRDPMPIDSAIQLLQEESGRHFDPEIVIAFIGYLKSSKFCLLAAEKEKSQGPGRKSPRIEYRTQVSAKFDRRVLSGNILDINPHGAYINTIETVDESTPLVLTFQPPGTDELVQVQGEVVWTNRTKSPSSANHPEGFGLQFTQLPEKVQALLEDFVDRHGENKTESSAKVIYPREFAKVQK